MNKTTTHWVLWISLLLVLPLPVLTLPASSVGLWSSLPVGYLLIASIQGSGWLYLLQGIGWAALLWWAARRYCLWSEAWEPKIRGSIMAITMLSLLILCSSIPIYRDIQRQQGQPLTFQWLYE